MDTGRGAEKETEIEETETEIKTDTGQKDTEAEKPPQLCAQEPDGPSIRKLILRRKKRMRSVEQSVR